MHTESGTEEQTDTSLLLPAEATASTGLAVPVPSEQVKYGTFPPSRSALQQSTPTTRAPTPAPSQKVSLAAFMSIP